MYCRNCGKELNDMAVICPGCGCPTQSNVMPNMQTGQKKTQVSVILGIIGIVSSWFLAIVGHVTSIIGIVYGVKEYKETGKNLGLILSIIGEVCSVISSLLGVIFYLMTL